MLKPLQLLLVTLTFLFCSSFVSAGVYMGTSAPGPGNLNAQKLPYKLKKPLKVTVYPGSLKANVEKVVKAAGWGQVVWNIPYDFNWVGKTTLKGYSMDSILTQLLKGYPLQAVYYRGNHVVAIVARNLK